MCSSIEALVPLPNERFLEIGFGTGRFVEMLLMSGPGIFVAGVDPASTVIVIQEHTSNPPDWLPNPLSRTCNEIALAKRLLTRHEYAAVEGPAVGSSRLISCRAS